MENIILETGAGDMFTKVAEKASELSRARKVNVQFEFNGITCIVSPDTNMDLLYRDYSNTFTMDWKVVGPDCLPVYEPEVQEELDKRKAESAEKYRLAKIEGAKKEDKERANFAEKVAGIEIKYKDKSLYIKGKDKNKDPYGAGVYEYAEGWMKLMQAEMAKGKTVRECAEQCSHEMGWMGITGFMYGCAVSILSACWEHGEELRKWHNKEYGHEGEGVVNPAILKISV